MHYIFDFTIEIHKDVMVRLLSDGIHGLMYICNRKEGRVRLG